MQLLHSFVIFSLFSCIVLLSLLPFTVNKDEYIAYFIIRLLLEVLGV